MPLIDQLLDHQDYARGSPVALGILGSSLIHAAAAAIDH